MQHGFAPSGLIARRLAIVLVLVVLDLWSKQVVFDWLEHLGETGGLVADPCARGHMRVPLVGEWFAFMLTLNPGAAFGQFGDFPHLLVWGRVGACLFLLWLLVRAPSQKSVPTCAALVTIPSLYADLPIR